MVPWQNSDTVRPSSVIVARPSLFAKNQKEGDSNPANLFNTESKRVRIERERDENHSIGTTIERERTNKRPRFEEDREFESFIPKERCLDINELRPQPIVRKRKKTHVPEHKKDDKYWEKRNKNTEATKRARDAKRLKDNQIIMRAAFLETENKRLIEELAKVALEREILKEKLNIYEKTPATVNFDCFPSDVVNTLYTQPDEVLNACPTTTFAAMNSKADLTSIQPKAYNSLNDQVGCPESLSILQKFENYFYNYN